MSVLRRIVAAAALIVLGGNLNAAVSAGTQESVIVAPEVTWSVMHPTEIDVAYMARVVAKADAYGGVDSFEVCGREQRGINALLTFDAYPHVAARVDRAQVAQTRANLNEVCRLAHDSGRKVYFWHRENLVPDGLFADCPELLDADGEFDMLSAPYAAYLRRKVVDALTACPGLDGLVLTLTESQYSVLHNSNQVRYPPVAVVARIVGIFREELNRRGKRLILRSFGIGDDYRKIIDGARVAAMEGAPFEIETKVTQADFLPWLPDNPYLVRTPPLSLGAECDALGEYQGVGLLPAAHVGRIRDYVARAREVGATRYVIRIDRAGHSIFDSAHEVNLAAYMRFIREPGLDEQTVLADDARRRFGAAGEAMLPLLRQELDMVRGMNTVASNLMFHTMPTPRNFKIAKAGGLFAVFREGYPLANLKAIWSIFGDRTAPTHRELLDEKARTVSAAVAGLARIEELKAALPPAEYERQVRAFRQAVVQSRAIQAFTRCAVAYFEDMAAKADRPEKLEAEVESACALIGSLQSDALGDLLVGLSAYCRQLLVEYRLEREGRRALEKPSVYDFVLPGGIYDDCRVARQMHAAYSEIVDGRLVRQVGNNRYPNGRITVRLNAPETAEIEVILSPSGSASCDLHKSWADGVWTASVGKQGDAFPAVERIAAIRR